MGGQAGQAFTQGIDDGDGHQQGDKQADLERATLPDADPGRSHLFDHRTTAFEQLVGQPVLGLEHGKAAMAGGAVDAVAQEGELPRVGGRERSGADDEDA